jgi:hypothetical protein
VTPAWRAEDEALLRRLEDEALLERVWEALAGAGAARPHPRAAGVLAGLRASVDGAVALERAARGELAPLLRILTQPPVASLTPRLAHHLALLHGQLARVLEKAPDAGQRAGADKAWLRALALWIWLGEQEDYLRELADAVVGPALSEAERARAAADAPLEPVARLGRRAREGAGELGEPSRVALAVLARVGEACDMAECGPALRARVEERARRERSAAVDEAIARIDEALEEAIVREAPADELVSLLFDGVAVWRWSGRDEQVERYLIQRVTPVLWDAYRERRWGDVRALLRPLEEPVENLALRIRRDPTKLAYAAPCAQMYVFRAEVAPTFEAQLDLAEKAVALCSTHRNGRLILADLLVERALRGLDTAMPWATGDALAKAARDVRRAEELYPQLRRLEDAKRRLKAMGRDLDA